MFSFTNHYQAYCQSERDNHTLQEEVKTLRETVAALNLRLQSLSSKKARTGNAAAAAFSEVQLPVKLEGNSEIGPAMVKDIRKLGQHTWAFHTLYADEADFQHASPGFLPTSVIRYRSPVNIAAGVAAELDKCIPQKYHPLMRLADNEKSKAFIGLVS